jgi:hypothetical protein
MSIVGNWDATWRDDSLRVAVVIADEEFAPDPDGPDRDATVDALVESDIRTFGVQYEPPPRPASDGLSGGFWLALALGARTRAWTSAAAATTRHRRRGTA